MAQLEKIMSIYYGSNKLPYKDEDRQINYPVLGGNLFIGENNVTTIRFYVDRIGGNEFTWLAVVKLPDGSKVFRQLSQASQEGYIDFDISSIYTSQQGAIFIALQGYTAQDTNVTIDDDNYFINGDPDILVTGVVKIMVNYAPQILNMGTDISYSQYQQILALLSKKLGLSQAEVYYQDITNISSGEIATSELANGQIVYDIATKWFYSWDTTNTRFNPISLNSKTYLKGAFPTISINMPTTTIQDLLDMGLNNKAFMISDDDEPYIYGLHQPQVVAPNIPVTRLYRYKVGGNSQLTYASSDTNTLVFYALNHGTTTTWENNANKVNEINSGNKESTTYYPSNKATSDYVDNNAIASYSFDSTTYQIKFFNGKGQQVGSTIDLPMESVVVSGTYDSTNKQIVLTLQNGSTITIGVSDLVSGLIPTSDIADNLTTNDSAKVLSAKQGYNLNNSKLNKLASSYHSCVYGHDSNGDETAFDIDSAVRSNAIALRDSEGRVRTATPSGNNDSVNKKYFDDYGEKLANKTTTLNSSSTDTQYPSAKSVYDIFKKVEDIANGSTISYLTSVEFTEQDIIDALADEVVYRYVNNEWSLITTEGEFNLWKSINQITLNQDFFASTNEQLVLTSQLTNHYAIIFKDDKFYLITVNDYDKLFKDGDNLFVIGNYLDRFYFSNVLEVNNGGSPIINVSVITSTTPTQNLNSLVSYKCTNALASLTISGLTQGQNDNNPTWQIQFVADTSFSVTLPVGCTWKYGTPTFNVGDEYTIVIEKRINNDYYAYLL